MSDDSEPSAGTGREERPTTQNDAVDQREQLDQGVAVERNAVDGGTERGTTTATVEPTLGRDTPVAAQAVAAAPDHLETVSLDNVAAASDWDQHAETINAFKQGDLLPELPISWTAAGGIDALTGVDSDQPDTGPVVAAIPDGPVIICSQTCDLGAGPPGDKHPMMLVAPVIHETAIGSKPRRKLAAQGKLGYLVQVLPADAAARERLGLDDTPGPASVATANSDGNRWYADLRLLIPVSKALLTVHAPASGFVTESEHLHFAETLAQKFRRPALNEQLSETLPALLKEFITSTGKTKQCFAKVEQVRVVILNGDRLNPARASLYVLTDGTPLTELEQDAWSTFNRSVSSVLRQASIAFASLIHADINDMNAARYRESIPVPCDLLGTRHWW